MSLISKSTNKTALAVSSYGTKIRNHNSPTEGPTYFFGFGLSG